MNTGKTVLITGSESGLGRHIAEQMRMLGFDVHAYDSKLGHDVRFPHERELPTKLDILINCAGVNIINWLGKFEDADWNLVMDVNAKGIFKMAKICQPLLKESKGTILNIVSNAAHMPMRCSAAYNASKGAALILTKQLARELIGDGITVFSVSPNKLKGTGMSDDIDQQVVATRGWTLEEAQRYQLQGLLTGKETDPARCAEFITFLLSDKSRHEMLAGCDLQYGL